MATPWHQVALVYMDQPSNLNSDKKILGITTLNEKISTFHTMQMESYYLKSANLGNVLFDFLFLYISVSGK
jgi:hypothetical protein